MCVFHFSNVPAGTTSATRTAIPMTFMQGVTHLSDHFRDEQNSTTTDPVRGHLLAPFPIGGQDLACFNWCCISIMWFLKHNCTALRKKNCCSRQTLPSRWFSFLTLWVKDKEWLELMIWWDNYSWWLVTQCDKNWQSLMVPPAERC